MQLLMNRIKGAIFAHACGDYLGMPVEFTSSPQKVKDLFGEEGIRPIDVNSRGIKPAGYYTDDTAMMLCLAQSLIEKGFDTTDQFSRYKKWALEGYMSADSKTAFGIGQNTIRKLMWQKPEEIPLKITNNEKEGGNGALMRCLPIGLVFHEDLNEIVDKSIKSALVTHNNYIAVWSTVVFNTTVFYALHEVQKDEYLDKILNEKYFSEMPLELRKSISNLKTKTAKDLSTSGYSLNTLEIALHCFLKTKTLQDAIKLAISLGGDTDTQGAVTGGLSGAYYGFDKLPTIWVDQLQNRRKIEAVAEQLLRLSS